MTYLEITRKLEKSKVFFVGICQPIDSEWLQTELTNMQLPI